MPKFTFICEHQDFNGAGSTTTVEFEKDYLYDVVEEFERFLRGSGFVFDGQFELVDDTAKMDLSQQTAGDSDFVVAGSVDDISSLTPSSAVFSFDSMISNPSFPDSEFSINTEKLDDIGVIFPEGNNEDIIHFRV